MNKIFLGILFSLNLFQVVGQTSIKTYTSDNLKQVSSIDPANINYSDLISIGQAIGDANVVMLGEQDHGDAPTFLAKTRLIKYLVEIKGFSVVAFESDFYSLNDGWNYLKTDKDSIKLFLQNNIFRNWTRCKQCDPLFNYLSESIASKKIDLTGFDNQSHGLYVQQNWSARFFSFVKNSGIQLFQIPASKILSKAWTNLTTAKNRQQTDSAFNFLINSLDSTYIKAKEKYGESNFWVQELKNRKTENEQEFAYASGVGFKGEAIRDRQMADNLLWLIKNKYSGKKIIVWAANNHVSKKAVNNDINNEFMIKPMGEVLTTISSPGISIYSIGFTSLQGKAGRFEEKHYTVPKSKTNSFELWVNDKKFDYAFINLKNLSNRSVEFLMKGEMYHRYANADWANIFDGIFYIKDMYFCDELK